MLFLWCILCAGEEYPLILGVPANTFVPNVAALTSPGILPENMCIFIIESYEEPEIGTINDLRKWGNAEDVCNTVGKVLIYPAVERDVLDFVPVVESLYEKVMPIDSAHECLCKMKNYKGGLLIVTVLDSEPNVVKTVLESLPSGSAVAFVPAI